VKDNKGSKNHWETVYRQKAVEETSWHQPSPKMSLWMIGRTAVSVETPIIDIGGGASLLADHLLGLGYRDVTVLDISRAALEQAQSRLGDRSKQLNWIEADVTRFRPARPYGMWHDRAAFHFLTDAEDQQRYASVLEEALEPGGQAIIATFSPQGPKKCSGLDIVRYDAQKIEKTLGPAFRLLEQQEDLHTTPAGREQRFNYFRILKI
jgi:2-polyprenyl-3-methyl-5-hydroxy-6-metoxy-1,4-benzoquinol methylase